MACRTERRRLGRHLIACLWCLFLLAGLVGHGEQGERDLFRDAAAAADIGPTETDVIRRRLVTIDTDVLPASTDAGPSSSLVLNLFADIRLTATATEITPTPRGYVWVGRISTIAESSATFAVAGGVVSGSVTIPAGDFTIRYAGNDVYVIRQVNRAVLPPESPPLLPDGAELADEPPPVLADDGSTIDLLVVYTPAARIAQNGTNAIEALIDLGVSETNQAYAAGGVVQRLRLVHKAEISYTEAAGNMSMDLARLRNTADGYLDAVHGLRNAYGADLVHLIVNNTNACGVAYLMTFVSTAFAASAFGVTDEGCISPNYSFAHELGHNMGLHHDAYVTGTATGAFPYSRGYVNQAAFAAGAPASKRWRDIMAYNDQCAAAGFNCARLLAFSSPLNVRDGDLMGHAATADAVRTLNETRFAVSNFRAASVPESSFSISDASVMEGHGGTTNARFTISLSAPSGVTTRVTYTTEDGTATSAGGSNADSILVPAAGNASPYPSVIEVPAGYGTVTKARVTIRGLTHGWPADLDILLVAPTGHTCLLMSDAGGSSAVNDVVVVFDDAGPALPAGPFVSGTYRPTNYDGATDSFSAPAPPGPYGSALSTFNGVAPAGTWRLFVVDDTTGISGLIAGGWTLSLETSSGADYVGASGMVTLPAGATSATVDIAVNGDTQFELPETFSVMLTASVGATIADQIGIGTIKNDDFTDDPLAGGLVMKSVHITELRAIINAVRVSRGMGAFPFAEALVQQVSLIRASHVAELRAALPAACAPPAYTDPVLTPGTTTIRGAHLSEIRAAIIACQ